MRKNIYKIVSLALVVGVICGIKMYLSRDCVLIYKEPSRNIYEVLYLDDLELERIVAEVDAGNLCDAKTYYQIAYNYYDIRKDQKKGLEWMRRGAALDFHVCKINLALILISENSSSEEGRSLLEELASEGDQVAVERLDRLRRREKEQPVNCSKKNVVNEEQEKKAMVPEASDGVDGASPVIE